MIESDFLLSNYYFFNIKFSYCSFEGSIFLNRYRNFPLNIRIFSFLIEDCFFFVKSIFIFEGTKKGSLILFDSLYIKYSDVHKYIIATPILKVVKGYTILRIINSDFLNLNCQATIFNFWRTKAFLSKIIFKSITNLSGRKQTLFRFMECPEINIYFNTIRSIINFENIYLMDSKVITSKILLSSANVSNIICLGTIILITNRNKIEFSSLYNVIDNITLLKRVYLEKNYNKTIGLLSIVGNYIELIFKDNEISLLNNFNNLLKIKSLYSNLMIQNNKYDGIEMKDYEFLAQNLFIIILSSIHSGYAIILLENFYKFTFRFSIYSFDNLVITISDVFFQQSVNSIDYIISYRWLMRCIDSIISISNINQQAFYLNLLININSLSFITNVKIKSFKTLVREFSFFLCFACIFQIKNINLNILKGMLECNRCYFILILTSINNKSCEISNLFISEILIIFSIITAFMANINILNLSINEYEYNAKTYPNFFTITEAITKNTIFFDYQFGKSQKDVFNFLTAFYFFLSDIKINNSNFSDINLYENPLIKSEYSSISIENSCIKNVFSLLESILCFINNLNIFLKSNLFSNNLESFGLIKIINELDVNKYSKFQIENQEFYINESLLILAMGNFGTSYYIDIRQIEFFRKYSNFVFQLVSNSSIFMISSNKIFNFIGSGIYQINDCYFNIIPKTLAFNLFDVDQLLIIQCSFVTKQILNDKPQISFYQNNFFNTSLIQVINKIKYLRILNSFFESSFGERGSVLYIYLPEINIFQSRVEIFNSTFVNNSALQEGGVFFFVSKDMFFLIKNNLFYLNSANTHGGVLYSESYGKIWGNTFLYNRALTSGGVIRWNKIEPIFECDDTLLRNIAEYGNFIASEPRHLILLNVSDSTHENKEFYDFYKENKRQVDFKAALEKDCDKFTPNIDFSYFQLFNINKSNIIWKKDIKIVFGLYDLYYQLAPVNHSFIFEIINLSPEQGIIKEKDFIKYDFNGFIILEKLQFTFINPKGIINFFIEKVPFFDSFESQTDSLSNKMESMLNYCFPEINYNNQNEFLTAENKLKCLLGEYFENSKCIRCPDDYYTLTFPNELNVSNSLNCKKKPNLARTSFGSVIIPYDGYWIEKGRDIIYECIYREACIYLTIDENLKQNNVYYSIPFGTSCLLGFDGNLCGECRNNTDLYKDNQCIDCEDLNDNIFFNSFNLIFFFVFYEIMIFSSGQITYESENKIETPLFKILMNMILSIEILKKKIAKMEITNDLVIEKKYTFEIYDEIMKYIGTLAHPSKMVTFRCLSNYFFDQQSYPYFTLISILTLPFVFLFFSLILFAFLFRGKNEMNLRFLMSKSVSLISVIQFLFIYELIKIFFSFLNCIPFYDDTVLKSFPNLSCSDENYLLSRNFLVLPFLLFFVFAIPILSYVNIYRNRHTMTTDDMIKKFGFIYLGYKPKLFFWEYVIYFKKISLIAFDVGYESNPFSISYFFGLSFIYLFYHYKLVVHQPYKSQILFEMEVLSSFSCLLMIGFCTIFASFQRRSIDLEMQLDKNFYGDYFSYLLNVFLVGSLFFLFMVMVMFLKIISTRYFSVINFFIFRLRRKNKESNKNVKPTQLRIFKALLFLNYLKVFEPKKKNILFLSSLSFQQNLIHLKETKILQFDILQFNCFVEPFFKTNFNPEYLKCLEKFRSFFKDPKKISIKNILRKDLIFMLELIKKRKENSWSSIPTKKKCLKKMPL